MAWEQFQKQRVFWQEIDHIDEWMKGNMYRRSDHQGMRLYRMDCWTRTIKSQKGQGKKAIRMMGRERKIRDKTKEKRDQHPRKAKQNEANKET